MNAMYPESVVEEATLDWFRELGYAALHGPEIDSNSEAPERGDYGVVVLRKAV